MTRGKELITAYEAAIASNSEFYYICHMNRIDNATVLVDGIVGKEYMFDREGFVVRKTQIRYDLKYYTCILITKEEFELFMELIL